MLLRYLLNLEQHINGFMVLQLHGGYNVNANASINKCFNGAFKSYAAMNASNSESLAMYAGIKS